MQSEKTSQLVTAAELAVLLEQGGCVVVDCRFNLAKPDAGEAAYRAGHIPGAVYAHLDRDLSAPRSPASGRHPLPRPEKLAQLFSEWGISRGTPVVAYDDQGGAIAVRLWWLLRWMGHQQAGLLDGGLPAWQAAGFELSATIPSPRPGGFHGEPGHMAVISTGDVERKMAGDDLLLLDARAPERFLGKSEPIDPVAGHIPGAVNQPFQKNLGPDGRFRSPQELRHLYQALQGAAAGKGLAVMCGSGVTACHTLFSMDIAGLPPAALYAGSWSEWIRDPGRPVSTDAGDSGI